MARAELENTALLATICGDPRDDAPRLVYADFLEARGATHDAELIRKQIAMAAAGPLDAEVLRVQARDRDWVSGRRSERPQPTLPAGLEWPPFALERGFVSRLVARDVAALVAHGERITSETPLTSLEIDTRDAPSLEGLARAPWLRHIRRVRFFLGRNDAVRLRPFFESPHLHSLVELRFDFEGIDGSGVSALMSSPLVRRLERLYLDDNFFVWWGAQLKDTFRAEGDLPWRVLSLGKNRIPPELLDSLTKQVSLPRLDELDLHGNPLGPEGLAKARWIDPQRIVRLDLTNTQLALDGVRALAAAPFERLRALSLCNNRLGPTALKALMAAPWMRSLEVLDLGNNPIGDKGAKLLAASPALERLVSLDLQSSKIGEEGLRALVDSPHLGRLQVLGFFEHNLRIADNNVIQRARERFDVYVPPVEAT
ncbi:MAG: TIGR02996 domain-containing protein [Polyangiaceae bacterium]